VKLLWIVADAARLREVQRTLREHGAPGWTVAPVIEGAGRTGVHSADRVHPGGLVNVMCVAEDPVASGLFEAVVRARDAAEDPVTRLFLLPVERQA
jgi:nitrogen regulatory protein PII